MLQRFVPGVLGLVFCAAMASAQTITVPATISAGDDISIGYSDSSRAGQTIVVTIDTYTTEHHVVEVFIHLDQAGRGTVTWTVPDVDTVMFNAPGARQVTRAL